MDPSLPRRQAETVISTVARVGVSHEELRIQYGATGAWQVQALQGTPSGAKSPPQKDL